MRGTSVALYDYAKYNEELLGNQSIIIIPKNGINDELGLNHFQNRFKVLFYDGIEKLENLLSDEKVDIMYCIKYGKNDGIFSKKTKTVIHCVFDMTEPHGDVYAGVSKSLANKFGSNLFVPHMVSIKKEKGNFREKLGIPSDAIVFGRYGGEDTFNIIFCIEVIKEILESRKDIYFLFTNTFQIDHPRVLYLPKTTSFEEKSKFINTCDAHLECGSLGHSFGLSIAEFSSHNKPIITYNSTGLWNTEHIRILDKAGIYFSNKEEFFNILNTFDPKEFRDKDLNMYKEFTPEKVMVIFKEKFIDAL